MAATIDARIKKILVELAADDSLSAKEKLEAIRYLIEIKARKPNPKAKSKTSNKSLLG